MAMQKTVQAKALTDERVLAAIDAVEDKVRSQDLNRASWFMRCDFADYFPELPEKVVLAKMKTMIRRGLIDGCTCGCRGDFERCAPACLPLLKAFG